MNLEEKAGALFVPHAWGVFLSESSPRYRNLVRLVRERHVGGVLWLVSNVYETAMLNARLFQHAQLLISADLEAGAGMRFQDATFWPPAMAVAATGDVSLAEAQGRITAIEARAIGVNHILAPVADVNVDPDNPVINARSFGEDPAEVSRYVQAFIRGVQGEGLLACAKHFPGHGDTHIDSHLTLPVLEVDRARLDAVELVPFRAAIEANVASVMIGHLSVPALDPLPATVSPMIIRDLLRRDLGYDGLIVSDAFDMGGITAQFGPGEAAVRALEAGMDQILMPSDIDAALDATLAAVRSGRLPMRVIDEAYERVHGAKSRVHHGVAQFEEIFRIVDAEEHRAVAEEIARRAITLVRDDAGLLPVRGKMLTIVATDFIEPNPLPDLGPSIQVDSRATTEEIANAVDAARSADVVLLALALRPKSGAGRIAVPEAAKRIVAAGPRKTIVVAFGSPYVIRSLPSTRTYIVAYGIQPVLQRAVLNAIRGETEMTGKLPVTIA